MDPSNDNCIALLGYRDAHHILGLPSSIDNSSYVIEYAYNKCREETLFALEKLNREKMNTFVISQLNYFELKLRAFDQARDELLGRRKLNNSTEEVLEGRMRDEYKRGLRNDENDRYGLNNEESMLQDTVVANSLPKEDDELDTIDIYFPSYIRRKPTHSRKLSKDSADMSSVSWLSKTDSDDNLSQVLGPLKTSPRGVAEFHSRDDHQYPFKKKTTQCKFIKGNRSLEPTRVKSGNTQTIEAARKGTLLALSEDDSVCLPLDNHGDAMVINVGKKTLKNGFDIDDYNTDSPHERQRERGNSSPVISNRSKRAHHIDTASKPSKSSQLSKRSTSSKPSSHSTPISHINTPANKVEEEYVQVEKVVDNEDDCDSILLSGIELAEDICGLFHSYCRGTNKDEGVNTSLDIINENTNLASDLDRYHDPPHNDRPRYKKEESCFSDEFTLVTDSESTAFNTTSSFGCGPNGGIFETSLDWSYEEKKMLV